ncbi:hypothetical protein AB5I41_29065 [Sphingomonas sp. MMS24-JH45]
MLAIAVTVIEVSLIVSLMLSDAGDASALARDTVFAAIMIILNGIVGLCRWRAGCGMASSASPCAVSAPRWRC